MDELWIKINPKTHKPEYIGIGKPAQDCEKCEFKNGICKQRANKCEYGEILETLYGDKNVILTPILDEEE
jgi:hypothetical protein